MSDYAANDKYLLVVLSGLDEGAEASVPRGKSLLGRGACCDFVFSDSELSEAHIELKWDEGCFFVTPLASGVRVLDNPLDIGEILQLKPGEVVSFADTEIAIFQAGALRRVPVRSSSSVKVDESDSAESWEIEKHIPSTLKPSRSFFSKRFLSYASLLIIGGFLLAAVPVTIAFPTRPALDVAFSPFLEKQGYDSWIKVELRDAAPVFVGVVSRNADRAKFTNAARREASELDIEADRLQFELVSLENLQNKLEAELDSVPANSPLRPDARLALDDGKVLLAGYVPTDEMASRYLQTVRSGVPEFVAVDDKLLTPARARDSLVALLSENDVAQTVSVAVDKNRLTLQGSLDAEKEAALRSLLSEWRDNTGNKIDLVFSLNSQPRPSTQQASAPTVPQASVQPIGLFLGDNPYVVLQGRKRLAKGDDWNGATVTSIGADGIQVTQSNQTVKISFAAQPMWVVHSSGVSSKQRS